MDATDTRPAASPMDRRADSDEAELGQAFLDLLAVPELAFALVVVGGTALVCCLAQESTSWRWLPGIGLVAAGSVGLGTLPSTSGGILLLVLAITSLTMEVLLYPGMALHAAGGAVALTLAGLHLEEPPPGVHPVLAGALGAAAGASVHWAARRSPRRAREDPFASGADLIGHTATLLETDGLVGRAVVSGQLWTVHAHDTFLRTGEEVRVTGTTEDHLDVQPINRRGRRAGPGPKT